MNFFIVGFSVPSNATDRIHHILKVAQKNAEGITKVAGGPLPFCQIRHFVDPVWLTLFAARLRIDGYYPDGI
jgi:hypothetical protein